MITKKRTGAKAVEEKKKKRKIYDSQRKAIAKYDRENTTQFKVKLNNKTDQDIIDHLRKQENKQGYIKRLIRDDMKK